MEDTSLEDQQRTQHLWKIGSALSKICPSASRYYLYNYEKNVSRNVSSTETTDKKSNSYCNHCGSLWAIDNHRVRVKPPRKPCGYIKALLKKFKTDPLMNRKEKKKVKKFLEKQQSKIVYTCFVCKKETELPGIVKPGRQSLKIPTLRTPLPKIKVKKRDLNAGLCVSIPADPCDRSDHSMDSIKSLNTSEVQSPSLPSTPIGKSQADIKNPKSDNTSKNISTPSSFNKTPVASNKLPPINTKCSTAQKKKKKSLSSLNLSGEQNSSKKRKSALSSFLVSL